VAWRPHRLGEHGQLPLGVSVEVFDVGGQTEPDFEPQLTSEFGLSYAALWVLHTHTHTHTHTDTHTCTDTHTHTLDLSHRQQGVLLVKLRPLTSPVLSRMGLG